MSDRAPLSAEEVGELSLLLDQVLGLPASARELWLAGLKPPLDRHRSRLSYLLKKRDAGGLTSLFSAESEPQAAAPPQRIGPYLLLSELGQGGMATVWLARNEAAPAGDDLVAIKLPHVSWRRADCVERLNRERAILAALKHPGITPLLDAGIDAHGQPYLVLEYVKGEPIDAYCRRHALGLHERLALFVQAGLAVAYAHRQQIVHRDLKPANMLVTAEGTLRLLDFGIAKLLDDGWSVDTELTHVAGRPLTYEYASPEQLRGEPVSVASDVYALGVVLYELLCERRPHPLEGRSAAAYAAAIVRAVPRLPSEAATEPAMREALRGDVDAVVMKALRKPASERYASVDDLLVEVQHCLNHRRVGAASELAVPSELARLDDAVLREFAVRGVVKRYPAGTVLIRQGDMADTLFIVLEGGVKIYAENDRGAEVVLGIMGVGNYFGELAIDGGRRDASVVTLEPSTFAVLGGAMLREFLAANPDFAFQLVRGLVGRVRAMSDSVKRLS